MAVKIKRGAGAKRVIDTVVCVPRLGVILALGAIGVLVSAGCGGGSSSEQTASSSRSAASQSPASTNSSTESATKAAKAKSESLSGEANSAAPAIEGSKHGRHISQPKGAKEEAPTPADIAHATVADMVLESPSILSSSEGVGILPATYTCDGSDNWPALRWTGVPEGTAELVLYVMGVQPVEEKLFVDWAVAGLKPSLEGVESGQLPKGAVVGTNSFGRRGYSICPNGEGETYMFAVYALPTALSPHKGFESRELRKQVLAISGNVGLLPVAYVRN